MFRLVVCIWLFIVIKRDIGILGGVLFYRILVSGGIWFYIGGWVSSIFFLVYVGALLIIFFYIISLSPKPVNRDVVWGGLVFLFLWGGSAVEGSRFVDNSTKLVGGFRFVIMVLRLIMWKVAKLGGGVVRSLRPFV